MLTKIYKFVKLPYEQKRLFVEAFVTLGVMKRAIDTKPLKDITKSYKHHKGYKKHDIITTDDKEIAILVGKIIQQAANHTPWQSACLVQSLTLMRMLRKRAIPAMFYLGVNKSDEMKAHAWSVYGDEILTGKDGYEKFTVVSSIEMNLGEIE
jgi:hypothetical protein